LEEGKAVFEFEPREKKVVVKKKKVPAKAVEQGPE
jgi:hypothetical protein